MDGQTTLTWCTEHQERLNLKLSSLWFLNFLQQLSTTSLSRPPDGHQPSWPAAALDLCQHRAPRPQTSFIFYSQQSQESPAVDTFVRGIYFQKENNKEKLKTDWKLYSFARASQSFKYLTLLVIYLWFGCPQLFFDGNCQCGGALSSVTRPTAILKD